ncbi:MAG TPA: hypothetical protein VH637_10775 [Streptosporangiaceae bacterium]|jgi:hypothetical protein
MQVIWPGLVGVGQTCLARLAAGTGRGALTNLAPAGTLGTSLTARAARPAGLRVVPGWLAAGWLVPGRLVPGRLVPG